MYIGLFEEALKLTKEKVRCIDDYGWYMHSVDDVRINGTRGGVYTFQEPKAQKILGFPVVVNDYVPQGTVYFLDRNKIRDMSLSNMERAKYSIEMTGVK